MRTGDNHSINLPTKGNLSPIYISSFIIAILMLIASAVGLQYYTLLYPTEELARTFIPNDVVNLLMVSIVPYQAYGPIFHIGTLLLVFAIFRKPSRLGRLMAGYIGVHYFVIAAAQTMGQTEKYGFVIHLSAYALIPPRLNKQS